MTMTSRERAEAVIKSLVLDLSDRCGLGGEWDQIDDEIQDEIKHQWATEVERALDAHAAAAVEAEREACAKILETIAGNSYLCHTDQARVEGAAKRDALLRAADVICARSKR